MNCRLASLLLTVGLVSGTAGAQAPAPAAPAEAPARATPPASGEAPARATPRAVKAPATPRKPPAAEAPPPAAAPPPPALAVQAVEYTFLRREDAEVDLVQLQQLGAEGWQVVATVEVDGSTRRYVLMRPKR
ncbi:MAG TPA: hypothetical protein VE153_23145 [Myxococcus sp.]|nr:hypothetical protein [Myxococcus sp.]